MTDTLDSLLTHVDEQFRCVEDRLHDELTELKHQEYKARTDAARDRAEVITVAIRKLRELLRETVDPDEKQRIGERLERFLALEQTGEEKAT